MATEGFMNVFSLNPPKLFKAFMGTLNNELGWEYNGRGNCHDLLDYNKTCSSLVYGRILP